MLQPDGRLTPATPPAEEPVTTAEAKAHLRVEVDDDDTLIAALVVAARRLVEARLARALVSQAWDLTLDGFPRACTQRPGSWERSWSYYGTLTVPLAPLASVSSITYVDAAGEEQTLDPSGYQVVAGSPGLVVPAYGTSWPATRSRPEAVTIRFTAGYGDAADVPQTLKLAVLLLVSHWYEHREAAIDPLIGNGPVDLPYGVGALLAAESWGHYA
ncbi:head-tail connector protein [Tautonia plasticadhaerens]|uniref:Phage gp6-like head-tail connector protein n=1 Tax=Tautonia plasticadhaerens TaxID=2527974 RepID=A0A518GZL5_9BACT|nr:head-tail connector protein [Tautonia plasticadhaerens]QDV34022.1 Phage gp6-like head-tail connector protein [Tautonia plasticadhaerens]